MKTSKFSLRFISLLGVLALVFQLVGPGLAGTIVVDTALSQYSFVVRGEFEHSTLGEVSILGDFNNDGRDDLLVGAPASNVNGKQFAGAAYVIYGGAPGAGLSLDRTSANITMYGAASGDVLGHSVAAGDVNGDGIDDILVGADLVDRNGTDVGAVYVFLGRQEARTAAKRVLQPSQAEVVIYGEFINGRFGRAVAAGDVTGNNIQDILVGAYYASPDGRKEAGAVYVIQGRNSFNNQNQTVIDLRSSPNAAHLRIYGASGGDAALSTLAAQDRLIHPALEESVDDLDQALLRGDRLGRSIAVGNVDGSGPMDIIAGAYLATANGQSEAGKTYVIYGKPQYQTAGNVINLGLGGQADITINGVNAGEESGFYVASGRMFDAVYSDIVIGAYRAEAEAGRVYVVRGGASLPPQINLASQANLLIRGAAQGDRLGRSLALAKIDDDNLDDLLLGASRAAPMGRVGAGTAYVIYTKQVLPAQINLANTGDLNIIRIMGAQSGVTEGPFACQSDVERGILSGSCSDELGRAITAGDFNGDGKNEIVVGALFSNNANKFNAGALYVFNTDTLGQSLGQDLYLPILVRNTR